MLDLTPVVLSYTLNYSLVHHNLLERFKNFVKVVFHECLSFEFALEVRLINKNTNIRKFNITY